MVKADGTRFRAEDKKLRWQYALESGFIDKENKTVVEVFKELNDNHDESEKLIATFSQVIAVGDVDCLTALEMPRERRFSQCPRCGFVEEI